MCGFAGKWLRERTLWEMFSLGDVFGEGGLTGADGVKRVCAVLDTVLHRFGSGLAEMRMVIFAEQAGRGRTERAAPHSWRGSRKGAFRMCSRGMWLRGKEEKCYEGFD